MLETANLAITIVANVIAAGACAFLLYGIGYISLMPMDRMVARK
jgi:hypothetical protein